MNLILERIYNYPIYPKDSNIFSDKSFVNIENFRMEGTHWTYFYIKDNASYYLDSFGGQPDKFLLNQLPKPIKYHNNTIQDKNSRLCGSYCLYFFYLIEKVSYYNTFSIMYFYKL